MSRDLSFERAIQFAAQLVRIPSLPGEEGAVAERIVDELRRLGFDEAYTDRAGNVVGRIAGAGDAPAVLLSSHMDVVDVGDPAGWEHDPWGGAVAGGCLHGRGSVDDKDNVTAVLPDLNRHHRRHMEDLVRDTMRGYGCSAPDAEASTVSPEEQPDPIPQEFATGAISKIRVSPGGISSLPPGENASCREASTDALLGFPALSDSDNWSNGWKNSQVFESFLIWTVRISRSAAPAASPTARRRASSPWPPSSWRSSPRSWRRTIPPPRACRSASPVPAATTCSALMPSASMAGGSR